MGKWANFHKFPVVTRALTFEDLNPDWQPRDTYVANYEEPNYRTPAFWKIDRYFPTFKAKVTYVEPLDMFSSVPIKNGQKTYGLRMNWSRKENKYRATRGELRSNLRGVWVDFESQTGVAMPFGLNKVSVVNGRDSFVFMDSLLEWGLKEGTDFSFDHFRNMNITSEFGVEALEVVSAPMPIPVTFRLFLPEVQIGHVGHVSVGSMSSLLFFYGAPNYGYGVHVQTQDVFVQGDVI